MENAKIGFDTIAVHGGFKGEDNPHPGGVPVHRTAAFRFKNTKHAAGLFSLEEAGPIYTRIGNPTVDVLEERTALLEGGTSAVAFASGTSAVFSTIANICEAGDEIVSSKYLYGGTYTMFHDILPQFGITARFVDVNDGNALTRSINEKTKLVYCETLGNPKLVPSDLTPIAKTAHEEGLPLVVDSTFSTPFLVRPVEFGADIVVHSLTKWLGGHGTAIGGIVVEGGGFDWNSPRYPLFSEPDPSYHGIVWGRDLGDMQDKAFTTRLRTVPLRNLGACISPDNAWYILQGIETLSLRMERHCANAMRIAEYLKRHSKVEWVTYPGLPGDAGHATAKKYFSRGFGGMVVFGIKGGREEGERFVNKCKLFTHLANVGDAKSLVIHPASTTHSQLSAREQLDAGITPEMVRLSIGLEDINDLISELSEVFGD